MVESMVEGEDLAFNEADRAAVYRVIGSRRDVRRGFLDRPLPDDLLARLLAAAHSAPSVGLMQPTRFIVIREPAVRQAVHQAFEAANRAAAATYPDGRAQQYAALKLEGILEAPQNICVVCDVEQPRGHRLGRHTMPETAAYSSVCAVQNLWLAARAEGVGVGWVSILEPDHLRTILHIPAHVLPVAYLCIGFVDRFAPQPELEQAGWESRIAPERAICYERYSEDDRP
jgi:5,6-dimethylbenzimidazole synthase